MSYSKGFYLVYWIFVDKGNEKGISTNIETQICKKTINKVKKITEYE